MIGHVGLEVAASDAASLASFFELLGFAAVEPPPTVDDSLWLEREGTQLHLLVVAAAVVPPEGHVAIVCADYDHALRRLRDAGFPPEPRRQHWGAPRCFVRAPGGHRVEVMAAPPR
jgi:catechol 2,3-dioxygenase-like lactoylglutathione lyase family enzyme